VVERHPTRQEKRDNVVGVGTSIVARYYREHFFFTFLLPSWRLNMAKSKAVAKKKAAEVWFKQSRIVHQGLPKRL
jgi:hypothetical protein